jgi:arylsulfatase A-like enzyme
MYQQEKHMRPNVVVIVLDDVGFSDLGCYGSEIPTPHMDRLAADGLRYNNFHVTAMCSPTRACLLTGRNAHSVGMGIVAEFAGSAPGYDGKIHPSAATMAQVIGLHGYNSYAVGKWHLAKIAEYGAAGPFANWPIGKGFNRWYGFHGALTDQYHPEIYVDNHAIHLDPPPNYHLSEDLVDQSMAMVRDHVTSATDAPFMLYLAFGACHWPHQVPKASIDAFRGKYDCGWDEIRRQRHLRQQQMGIIPAGTRLAPRNPGVTPWEEVAANPALAQLSTRLQETYAGFLSHTDAQIGRLVAYLDACGILDDTMIVLISDNGASPEGGIHGTINQRKHSLYEKEVPEELLGQLDRIGGPDAFNHYSHGWAQVSNTPLKWFKKDAHGGGIRAPLIVRWPQGIKAKGEIRSQYHHVIDLAPTIYEILGVAVPDSVGGVGQLPIHGTSLAYTFDSATAPTRRETQYFEILCDRAVWHKGWKAVTRHDKGTPVENDVWELYDLDKDFSETNDLAGEHPEKLRELQRLWVSEAEKYQVLPLDDREWERSAERNSGPKRTTYEYLPHMARIDRLLAPDVNRSSFRIIAEVCKQEDALNGVILAWGTAMAGLSLYVKGGEIVFEYAYTVDKVSRFSIPENLPSGDGRIVATLLRRSDGGVDATLEATGVKPASLLIPKTWPINGTTGGLTCGHDSGHAVSRSYRTPFAFSGGLLSRVIVSVGDENELSPRGIEASPFAED